MRCIQAEYILCQRIAVVRLGHHTIIISTQGRYATIEKYVLTSVGENRVHIAHLQESILEFYVITSVRHILLFILCHNKGMLLTP